MKIKLVFSSLLMCCIFPINAQSTNNVPIDSSTIENPTSLDSTIVYEMKIEQDCIHGHSCCHSDCPCCPLGETAIYALFSSEVLTAKKRKRQKKN